MRLTSSLKTFSLGVTTLAFLAAGAAWALPNDNGTEASMSWLAGGTARLDHALDAKTAKPGQVVEAKLEGTVKTADGTELPRGTTLRGTVAAVHAPDNGQAASISVLFDQAQLKDGKTLPVKVAIIGAYPNDEGQLGTYGGSTMPNAPERVPLADRFDQEPGTLSHIAMTSRASGSNSATFTNQKGDVKLEPGTFLQVGIAQRQGDTMAAGN